MFSDKFIVAASLTVLLFSGSSAQAQQGPGGPMMPRDQQQMMPQDQQQMQQRREMMAPRSQQYPSREDEYADSFGEGMMCPGYGPGWMHGPGGRYGGRMRGPGAAMGPGMMGPGMRRMMFALMDADGDGSLSQQEFLAGHERIFRAMDANKDGRVTPEELRAFMSGRPAQQQ